MSVHTLTKAAAASLIAAIAGGAIALAVVEAGPVSAAATTRHTVVADGGTAAPTATPTSGAGTDGNDPWD